MFPLVNTKTFSNKNLVWIRDYDVPYGLVKRLNTVTFSEWVIYIFANVYFYRYTFVQSMSYVIHFTLSLQIDKKEKSTELYINISYI